MYAGKESAQRPAPSERFSAAQGCYDIGLVMAGSRLGMRRSVAYGDELGNIGLVIVLNSTLGIPNVGVNK
jgi:hypothetical protein